MRRLNMRETLSALLSIVATIAVYGGCGSSNSGGADASAYGPTKVLFSMPATGSLPTRPWYGRRLPNWRKPRSTRRGG